MGGPVSAAAPETGEHVELAPMLIDGTVWNFREVHSPRRLPGARRP